MSLRYILRNLSLVTLLLSGSLAWSQTFIDSYNTSSCDGSKIRCGPIQVTEFDNRPPKHFDQPQASERVMGLCGRELPAGQDYQARPTGIECRAEGTADHIRRPMPIDLDRKDKADQLLSSSMDDITKRTKAQEILKSEIKITDTFSVPMTEHWVYTVIAGDYNGPSEVYETSCSMSREEQYQQEEKVYREECGEWKIIPPKPVEPIRNNDRDDDSTYTAPKQRESAPKQRESAPRRSEPETRQRDSAPRKRESESKPRESAPKRQETREPRKDNSERMNGTSSDEIQKKSRDNYEKLKKRRNGQYNHDSDFMNHLITRSIAQERRCVRWDKVYDHSIWHTRYRSISPITGRCLARRGTWRTFPVQRQGWASCPAQPVKVNVTFKHDSNWTPANSDYLGLLPNKFDLLPGESEELKTKFEARGSSLRADLDINNAWNNYRKDIKPQSISCDMAGEKVINIDVHTENRIKRKAPNPFALPANQEALIGLDSKGRPEKLMLIDQARGLRLDSSLDSRRFSQPEDKDAKSSDIGSSEAGGSKAFWVSTKFRMSLYRIDGWGRRFLVTMPNKFETNKTDIFDNDMLISLGGEGGMDRLYRPAGPLAFLFEGLYQYMGVELSPHTNYELEVRAAQQEFPFYESTCQNGALQCDNEDAKDEMFSEAVVIKFKTEETKRGWIKWLLDHQIVIY